MITDPLLLPHICPIHSRRHNITNEESINYNTGSPHANLLQRDYCSMIGMLKWLKATSLSTLICASVPDEQLALCEAAYLDAPCHLNNNPFKYKESIAPLVSDNFLWAAGSLASRFQNSNRSPDYTSLWDQHAHSCAEGKHVLSICNIVRTTGQNLNCMFIDRYCHLGDIQPSIVKLCCLLY